MTALSPATIPGIGPTGVDWQTRQARLQLTLRRVEKARQRRSRPRRSRMLTMGRVWHRSPSRRVASALAYAPRFFTHIHQGAKAIRPVTDPIEISSPAYWMGWSALLHTAQLMPSLSVENSGIEGGIG